MGNGDEIEFFGANTIHDKRMREPLPSFCSIEVLEGGGGEVKEK